MIEILTIIRSFYLIYFYILLKFTIKQQPILKKRYFKKKMKLKIFLLLFLFLFTVVYSEQNFEQLYNECSIQKQKLFKQTLDLKFDDMLFMRLLKVLYTTDNRTKLLYKYYSSYE